MNEKKKEKGKKRMKFKKMSTFENQVSCEETEIILWLLFLHELLYMY